MPNKVKIVVKDGAPEIPVEVIADSIVEISRGVQKLRAGRLNERALVLLIQAACGQSVGAIKAVLAALESLEATYLKKKA